MKVQDLINMLSEFPLDKEIGFIVPSDDPQYYVADMYESNEGNGEFDLTIVLDNIKYCVRCGNRVNDFNCVTANYNNNGGVAFYCEDCIKG